MTIDAHCGLCCATCTFRTPFQCGGCIATNGHPFHGACPIAACCQRQSILHCGECSQFPCELLQQYSCDPEHGDIPKGVRIAQCFRWRECSS